jgi:hypothetical protein
MEETKVEMRQGSLVLAHKNTSGWVLAARRDLSVNAISDANETVGHVDLLGIRIVDGFD